MNRTTYKKFGMYSLAALIGPLMVWQVQGRMVTESSIEPFFAEMETKTFKEGVVAVAARELVGLAADGSKLLQRPYTANNGEKYDISRVSLVKDGVSYVLHSAIKSKTTTPMTKNEIARLQRPDPRCGLGISAEHSKILGFNVFKYSRTRQSDDADNELTIEAWLAPALGCHSLQTTVWQDGEIYATTQAKWLRRESPPSQMFELPPDYVEKSPGQVLVSVQERFKSSEVDLDLTERLDAQYQKRLALRVN